MASKKSKSHDQDSTKKKKSSIQKDSPEPQSPIQEKTGIERYLNPDVEMVNVTEEIEGQTLVFFGGPSGGR